MADESRVQGVTVERGEYSAWINGRVWVSAQADKFGVNVGGPGRRPVGMRLAEAATLALELTRIVAALDKARTEGRGIA